MEKPECLYGIGIGEPSTIEEFDKYEGPRVIKHINHPLKADMKEDLSVFCVWLKTYGLAAFWIRTPDVEATIKQFNLVKE